MTRMIACGQRSQTHRKLVLVSVMAMAALGWLTPALCRPGPRARLVRVVGAVKLQRGGRGGWTTVSGPAQYMLYGGDHVQTLQRASATILIDGARVSLGPGTHVAIPPARPERPAGVSRLRAFVGRLLIRLIGSWRLELGTEVAVASASGTAFVVEVSPDGTTVATVLEGSVTFHNDLGTVVVAEGEQSHARPGSAPSRPMRVDPSGYIEWEASLEALWLVGGSLPAVRDARAPATARG